MDPRLTGLLELQEAMSSQRDIEKQYQEIPKRREEMQSILRQLEEDIHRTQDQIKHTEVEIKTTELDLRQGQEARVKKESLANTLKTPKEVQANKSEIENLDRKNTRLEERIVELMDQVEKGKKALEAKKAELEAKRSQFASELQELDDREKSLGGKVEAARNVTQSVAKNIGPDLFRRFERVFKVKQGMAVATANGGHCGGCNIRLTPRLIQLAKRGQDIVICEGCSRFLYWDASLEEENLTAL